jgi:hypothetical protein
LKLGLQKRGRICDWPLIGTELHIFMREQTKAKNALIAI